MRIDQFYKSNPYWNYFYVSTNKIIILSRYYNRRFPTRFTRQVNYFAE